MQSEFNSSSWLDRTVWKAFPQLNIEMLLVVIILLVAMVSRFYDLGARVMSHDETNHVVPSYDLYQGRGYSYDPVTHGPLQFHLIALSYFIFGDSDFTSRLPAALCSIATVAFALFGFRRYLGRIGSLISGFLFLISPYMLFYGRYARDEAIYVFFTIFLIWSMLRYLEAGQKKFLYCVTAALAFNFVTMESAYIYTAQAMLFSGVLFVEQISRRQWQTPKYKINFLASLAIAVLLVLITLGGLVSGGSESSTTPTPTATTTVSGSLISSLPPLNMGIVIAGLAGAVIFTAAALYFLFKGAGNSMVRKERSFDLMLLMGFLVLPLLTAFPVKAFGFDPLDYSSNGIIHTAIFLIPMVLIAILIGWWWNPGQFIRNGIIFYVIFIFFFTTFFTNGSGFFTGIVGSLGYWMAQQAVNRGSQPWYYYWLIQIPIYEFLPAAGALLAAYFGWRRWLWVNEPGKPFVNALPQSAYDLPSAETLIDEFPAEQEGELTEEKPETSATISMHDSSEGKSTTRSEGIISTDNQLHENDQNEPLVEDKPYVRQKEDLQIRPVPVLGLLLFWMITSLIAFSIAGEKMPWLTVNPDLGLILSAGWGLGFLIETAPWTRLCEKRPALILALLAIFLASFAGTLAILLSDQPPFQGVLLNQLQSTSTFLFSGAALIISGYFLFKQFTAWKWIEISKTFLVVFFFFLAVLTIRTSFRASYVNYDNAMEFLVYAHGATGSKDILQQVQQISFRTTGGKDIAVAYDNFGLYPFWWYFRDYPDKVYFTTPTNDLRNSPIVIAGQENYAKVDAILGDAYYKFDYIRLWWPMQDYFNLNWDRVWNAISNPQMRTAVFDIWFNRDYSLYGQLTSNSNLTLATWQPSDHFAIYIRKDIVSEMWQYGVQASAVPTVTDPYAQGEINLPADFVIGGPGTAPGSFDGPRQFAFAPDGTIYVADSRNNRIEYITQDGNVLQVWGSYADVQTGAAPGGTFNEPWGVAVGPDGSVYVADTFNYRIQKFTADGKFITMWGHSGTDGSPDAFYGPRGLAVDSQGRLFVTDTGNKRVVVFDKDGNYIAQFGGPGTDPGQFDEPVGIALDEQGNVYVADTWNQRVQVFSPNANGTIYSPLTQWSISGWYGQSLDNKPFIAVDTQQHVFVTDPEASRILEFDNKGNFIRTWGQPGTGLEGIGLASGIAIDSQGHVWVSDSDNDRLLRYTLPSP